MRRITMIFMAMLFLSGFAAGQAAGGNDMTGSQPAILSFHSFDGGGSGYDVVIDSDIVSWNSAREYFDANHEELDGAAYQVVFTFDWRKMT